MHCRLTAATAVLAVFLSVSVGGAQQGTQVVGFVKDSTGRAIAGAEVQGGRATVRTGDAGQFSVPSAGDDSVRVLVRKVGFEPTVAIVYRDLERSPIGNVVTLLPLVARLDRVLVEGAAYDRTLWEHGFYRRQRGVGGRFFDPADVAFWGASGLAPLLRTVPRVEVVREGTGDVAYGRAGGRACRMHLWIDGVYQRLAMPNAFGGGEQGLRDLVDPSQVYAVEVYSSAVTVPAEFQRGSSTSNATQIPSINMGIRGGRPPEDESNAPCGAVVIWTRDGVARTKP